jgi:hypothetical protein
MTNGLRGFPQSLQANTGTISQIRLRSLSLHILSNVFSYLIGYVTKLAVSGAQRHMIEWLMNWKGFGRKRSSPDRDIPTFAWTDSVKPRRKAVRIASVAAEFPTQNLFFCFFGLRWEWVQLVRRPLTGRWYQPRMISDECGAFAGMKTGRGNWSTRKKPAPVSLCPPQISYDLNLDRTRATAMRIRRLTV